MPFSIDDLRPEEREEVRRLLQGQGWLAARDYLRERGYTVEQANDVVLPRRRLEAPAYEGRPAAVSRPSQPWWQTLIENIGHFLEALLPFAR
jgi:hypothetical protein